MERNYKLYVHISPSGKRYYGITKQEPGKRWQNGKGYRKNEYFTNSINKYGWDSFTHEVLFNNLTEAEAKLLEQCYIALYDTTNRGNGYNITAGGEGTKGYNFTEEHKHKLSEAHKGKTPWNKGKTGIYTEETKKKISSTRTEKGISKGENHPMYGKHHTEETRDKISEAKKGKNFSEEHKQKLSEAKKGKNAHQAKSVICVTTNRIFFTAKEAGKYYSINRRNISSCCKGKRNYCGKLPNGTKLVWRYLNYKHNKTYRVIKNKEVT